MQLVNKVDPDSKLRIKKFFEENDVHEYVRSFVSRELSGENNDQDQMQTLYRNVKPTPKSNPLIEPLVKPMTPTLQIEFKNGRAFKKYEINNYKEVINLDIEVFGKRYRLDGIHGCQSPDFAHTFNIHIPNPLRIMIETADQIHICLSTTSSYPNANDDFLGLASIDWRDVLKSGKVTDERIEIRGLKGGIVGVIDYSMTLCGYEKEIDYTRVYNEVKNQKMKEHDEQIASTSRFETELNAWWHELNHIIDADWQNEETKHLYVCKAGSGEANLFSFITPFTNRSLYTPGYCLRLCSLLSPIVSPENDSCLPNWATVASRCGNDREKLHLLVSLLRGFGMRAFVVVAQPRCFVITISSPNKFFDVRTGKFSNQIPKGIKSIAFIYNDESLYVNLKIGELDWDLDNQLKWKMFKVPKDNKYDSIPVLSCPPLEIDEGEIENAVKSIIEAHRKAINLNTRWNNDLPKMVLPIIESYEWEKVNGSHMDVHSLASESIRKTIRKYHAFRAAPAVCNSINPGTIFSSLTKISCGSDILTSTEDDASFVLTIKCTQYPGGIVATWAIIALDSVTPLHDLKQ